MGDALAPSLISQPKKDGMIADDAASRLEKTDVTALARV